MKKQQSGKSTALLYTACQAFYWAALAATSGFTAVFLVSKGVSDDGVGIAVSLAAVSGILMQLFSSGYLDGHPSFPAKFLIAGLCVISALTAFFSIFASAPFVVITLYVLSLSTLRSISPVLSTLSVTSNIHIPFAVARGVGSTTYAFASLAVGLLIKKTTGSTIMAVYIPLCLMIGASIFFMREEHVNTPSKDENVPSYTDILKGNRPFLLFLAACILNGVAQSASSTFLIRIIEECGGGAGELGIALFVQSASGIPVTFLMVKLRERISADKFVAFSFFAFIFRIAPLAFVKSVSAVYIIMAVNALCIGIFCVSSVDFADSVSRENEKARAQALLSLCSNSGIGQIIGGVFSGIVLDAFGVRPLFAICGVLCALSFIVMLLCIRFNSKPAKTA